jgi:hypothetical protein
MAAATTATGPSLETRVAALESELRKLKEWLAVYPLK